MKCENCDNIHTGEYGSGRFCTSKCARGFSTKAKRKEINKIVSKKLRTLCEYGCNEKALYTLKNGKKCCNNHSSKCLAVKKKNSDGLKKAYKENRMNCDHLDGKRNWAKGKTRGTDIRLSNIYGTVDDALSKFSKLKRVNIRKIIIQEKLLDHTKCSMCGLTSWRNKSITMDLDHINGDCMDHRLENLRFICPNCHSQTTTYKAKNIKKNIISEEVFIDALKKTNNIAQALKKLGLTPKGANYERAYSLKEKYDIE